MRLPLILYRLRSCWTGWPAVGEGTPGRVYVVSLKGCFRLRAGGLHIVGRRSGAEAAGGSVGGDYRGRAGGAVGPGGSGELG